MGDNGETIAFYLGLLGTLIGAIGFYMCDHGHEKTGSKILVYLIAVVGGCAALVVIAAVFALGYKILL